nr:MAG TPA: hypothetical protein [Caudoviricetes sp.]
MNLPQIVEVKGIRVLTTRQIAEAYEVKEIQIHHYEFTTDRRSQRN